MYISSLAESTNEMPKEFLDVRDQIIKLIDTLTIEQRFALLIVLSLDTAMLLKYAKNMINSEEDIKLAMGTLWAGPLKKASVIVAQDHIDHLKEPKN